MRREAQADRMPPLRVNGNWATKEDERGDSKEESVRHTACRRFRRHRSYDGRLPRILYGRFSRRVLGTVAATVVFHAADMHLPRHSWIGKAACESIGAKQGWKQSPVGDGWLLLVSVGPRAERQQDEMTIETLLVFVLLDVGFRVFGFAPVFLRVKRWGERSVSTADAAPLEVQRHTVRRALAAVRTATRYYHRGRLDCLPRALATYLLLQRRGVSARLHIGVKRFPFAAHAWVECLGEVLDESTDDWRHEPYVTIVSTREPV